MPIHRLFYNYCIHFLWLPVSLPLPAPENGHWQEILALSGTNTIYTDTGDTTVSGRADPNTIIQQLAARIAALESAVVSN